MKYNLNLTREYCAHWGIKEALRELIANTIDEDGVIKWFNVTPEVPDEIDEDDIGISHPRLTLSTNSVLPVEAFLMGYSVKSKRDSIGQYGEGLKIAMLILARENIDYKVLAGNHAYKFEFDIPEGFGVETLHLIVEEHTNHSNDGLTLMVLDGLPSNVLDGLYIDAPVDSVLKGVKGLYCHGLLVEQNFYVSDKMFSDSKEHIYGINLAQSVKGNRDRNYFPNKKLIVPVLEKCLEPEFFVDLGTSWFASDIYANMSDEFAQRVAKAYINKTRLVAMDLTNLRVIFGNSLRSNYSRKDGYYIAAYWAYGTYIQRGDDAEVLKSLELDDDDAFIDKTDVRVTSLQRRAKNLYAELNRTTDLAALLETLVMYIPLIATDRTPLTKRVIEVAKALIANQPIEPENYEDEDEANE